MQKKSLIVSLVHCLSPERAHHLGLWALRHGMLRSAPITQLPALRQSLWGISFPNPVGLAAGFDKNATAYRGLLRQGFGFVETGTVTPLPQPGNARPRIFRLYEDRAVINRLGFNNMGLEFYCAQIKTHRTTEGVVGANIGKNKDSEDAVADYTTGLAAVYAFADYVTVNISSPNTQGLRALQHGQALDHLLGALSELREKLASQHAKKVPLLLKIAPDLEDADQAAIAASVRRYGVDGVIVSNTTISRPDLLRSRYKNEAGGLSGAPLMALATEQLRRFYRLTEGTIPLIGVGGIASARDAYAKIRAGASLVQLYSALVYQGFSLVHSMPSELAALLEHDGFTHLSQAVGADHR